MIGNPNNATRKHYRETLEKRAERDLEFAEAQLCPTCGEQMTWTPPFGYTCAHEED